MQSESETLARFAPCFACDSLTCIDSAACQNETYIHQLLIEAQTIEQSMLERMQLGALLGEGAFGAVYKTADSRYAIKIQDGTGDCLREATIQYDLANLRQVSVAKVYFFSDKVTALPMQWRPVIAQTSSKKGSYWAARNWQGRFCIIVMDFLQTTPLQRISRSDMPAALFGLLYTLQSGYVKIGFEHLDIHAGNVTLVPSATGAVNYATMGCTFSFPVQYEVRLLDFGLSITSKFPSVVTYNMSVSSPESVIQQMTGQPFVPYQNFDMYSVGLLVLNIVAGGNAVNMPLTGAEALIARASQNDRSAKLISGLQHLLNICVLEYALGNGPYPTGIPFEPGTWENYLFIQPQQQQDIVDICKASVQWRSNLVREVTQIYGVEMMRVIKTLMAWKPADRFVDLKMRSYFAPFRRC